MIARVNIFAFLMLFSLALRNGHASYGKKVVNLETIPSGATVEVNGSVTCTTPCPLELPGYYFGHKKTGFAKYTDEPVIVRFVKEGYLPKEVTITTNPIRWTS